MEYQDTIRATVREVVQSHGIRETEAASPDMTIAQVDREIMFLFAARYLLEDEVRRAYNRITAGYVRPSRSAIQQARILLDNKVIDETLFEAIAEVYGGARQGFTDTLSPQRE